MTAEETTNVRTESRRSAMAAGLYDPAQEHDACGLAFVVDMQGRAQHDIVAKGLLALCNLDHRGASGAEVNTGDGAGILISVPDAYYRAVCSFDLPEPGAYATGIGFLSADHVETIKEQISKIAASEGLEVLGWREVPVEPTSLGAAARAVMPTFHQIFVTSAAGEPTLTGLELDRRAFVLRKRLEHEVQGGDVDPTDADYAVYFASLSARTIVYKGMLTTHQLRDFFPELSDERVVSPLALVHSRFSTNTFPSWPLAHPYRYVAHNGEINTVQGNRNWMSSRLAQLGTDLIPGEINRVFPICTPGASDTATFDEVLEILHMGGYELPHAVLMMIPEAWERNTTMARERRDFFRYHATLMEPWDGPASIAFSDGTVIGAVLDRNGLRPSRYWVTDDGLVVMASEAGVLDIDPQSVVQKGRLQPGRMFLVDTRQGRIVDGGEVKAELAAAHPYGEWLDNQLVPVAALPSAPTERFATPEALLRAQREFGYTHEELKILLSPMAANAKEGLGSMGTDTPVAVLSDRSRLLYDYFTQLFAQVTNPPLDAIREEMVTSVRTAMGSEGNILDPTEESCHLIELDTPVLTIEQTASIKALDGFRGFRSRTLSAHFDASAGGAGLEAGLASLQEQALAALDDGINVLVLSDRGTTAERAAIPALLATASVHLHLVKEQKRSQTALMVETAEAREVHHVALLIGFGAKAVNPYLAMETIEQMAAEGMAGEADGAQAVDNYVKAASNGILKIMSKMGISTVASYTGAQIFEAIGLGPTLIADHFTGCVSRLGGIELEELATETLVRHHQAYPERELRRHRSLEVGGEYQWRREGEYHLFNPETVFKLQHATRSKQYDVFKEYTTLVDDQAERLATLRGLFQFASERPSVPIGEVESAASIIARFSTGAMSLGSISPEAHETLAIAMNRLGGKSNTGEGGEDPDRFTPDANGDLRRSSIKQVASGRFGVTSEYLVNSDDIQIKMAQGAKPGEGGQLPGHKVYPWIAEVRKSTPGVQLISPPPHHDIYSIEDLAQLIHDLKNANDEARVHVKLVAEVGVGTVAAGVSKAHADVVLISGHDGGTGASPLTSLKHAGAPWELGLAETQQTLLINDLRDRIVVQVDGQLKTGRDVMIAALLGAEEFGFATAPLVVSGCIMMRVCHLDTCPVGIATQNKELRKKYTGQPEFVENFFEFIAEEVRELMAELGFRTLDEAVGQVDVLDTTDAVNHWKANGLDLGPILHKPEIPAGRVRHHLIAQDHGLDRALDQKLIALAQPALERGEPVNFVGAVRNVNRTVGTLLGSRITRAHGPDGLPDNTIDITLKGSAGQSFGAFVPRGLTLRLRGDSNDYFGKGLSGGRLTLQPLADSHLVAEDNVIAGNVILYGATAGEVFIRGLVGERFCVRNSGAIAVVEGIGDHGCEYMTGGKVLVLGPTGRNFGAGMSGGVAFVYDADGTFPALLNPEMVDLVEPTGEDRAWLKDYVSRHLEETGSAVAERMLADWDTAVGRFAKVFPRDYARVLEAMSEAEAAGADVDAAVMALASD